MALIWTLATSMRFWLGMVIVSLTLFGTVQTLRLNEALDDLNKIRTLTDIARNQSDAEFKILRDAFPFVVAHASQKSWAIAKTRFGACPPAGGTGAGGVLHPSGDGQAATAESDGGTKPEFLAVDRPFVGACTEDAGFRNLVIKACKSNPLICEFK